MSATAGPSPAGPYPHGNDDKERVRAAVDIADLIGSYIDLRRQGRNYVGLCPWHDDSKPSLNVNPERQSWKCWVCDVGGDIFSFVMKREGLEFPEALRLLAERAGIELSRRGKRTTPGDPNDKQTLFKVMAWAEKQFRDCYLSDAGKEAREYVSGRGITEACAERFRLGYSPSGWQWLLDRARGTPFSEAHLMNVGLIGFSDNSRKHFDRFRERLMFSIHDVQGRTVGFGGRILPSNSDERAAKYINSPDTRLFTKSDHLFGLDLARDTVSKDRHVVIVEGYTDVMMAAQNGLTNVVAVLGTALGERHIGLLKRFADRVTLVLDGDEAGQRRSTEVLELFVQGAIDLRIATLPDGLDPCDFIDNRGAHAFQDCVEDSVDALQFKVQVATAGIDVRRDVHAANKALEDILNTVARLKPPAGSSASEQQLRMTQVLGHLSRLFRLDESRLRERLRSLRSQKSQRRFDQAKPASSSQMPVMHDWDGELFEVLLKFPDLAQAALAQLRPDDLQSEIARQLYAVYARLLESNRTPDFDAVILLLDEQQKTVLVGIDERASKRPLDRTQAAEALDATVAGLLKRRQAIECETQMEELDRQHLTEDEQMAAFMKLLEAQRDRRGISTPTDG